MNATRRISVRGSWPGPVTLRSGWWKGVCRRLNDDTSEVSLRIERGSVEFVARCAEWILADGAPVVWSPPLTDSAARMWRAADFVAHRRLVMFERSLSRPIGEVAHPVRAGVDGDWTDVARIDTAAFEETWRMGQIGLRDAMTATPTAKMLIAEEANAVAAFSIVGTALTTSYLQRIAVDPVLQGRGLGRTLVRASMVWAREQGARTMLLNTQLDNEGAAALYRSEGFATLPDRLTLYRRLREDLS